MSQGLNYHKMMQMKLDPYKFYPNYQQLDLKCGIGLIPMELV